MNLDDLAREVDELATRIGFSGVVRVDGADGLLFETAHGLAHRAHGIPNTTDTRFAIASGTKTFTALAVVSLIEDGTLALNTTARSLLGPDLPLIADYVAHLHVKDSGGQPGAWDFPTPGQGVIDFASLFRTLRSVDYAGPCSVELEQPGRTLTEQDEAMREAYRFVAATLATVAAG